MKIKNSFSVFAVTFLMAGLFFLAFTTIDASAGAAPPGCCTTEMGGGECVDCEQGDACFTSSDYCSSQGGFFSPGICFDEGAGAVCGATIVTEGCCVIEFENCVDDVLSSDCFADFPDAEIWVSSQSCINVPRCNVARPIPTLSHWGLIALAVIFILVGVWAITRKKAEA